MKNYLFAIVLVLTFTGCITDGFYNVGKTIYVNGKRVVVAYSDNISPETLDSLKELDKNAKIYDELRKDIKKAQKKSVD